MKEIQVPETFSETDNKKEKKRSCGALTSSENVWKMKWSIAKLFGIKKDEELDYEDTTYAECMQ